MRSKAIFVLRMCGAVGFAQGASSELSADGKNLLSKREEEVVELVEQPHLSDHTVKNHLFHIFNKLGISSRVELVLYAVSNSKRPPASISADELPLAMAANSRT